ncbi:MAG TPA: endo alpha-1,4 polygalactosaminidase [Bacteroidia bacterium]|nr:endo alpha-1,4 polygalactosaminidase [Bacteroidia bacterium]
MEKISRAGRNLRPGFIVIPQNGLALLSSDGTPAGNPETTYLNAIDGVGQEELWYGYDNKDDVPTPDADHANLSGMCGFARDHGLKVLVTDYCTSSTHTDDSYSKNSADNFISFAADHRELDDIPSYPGIPFHSDTNDITTLSSARNFLYIISPSSYATKADFIHAIAQTNYDVVIMDLFFDESTMINSADLALLRYKPTGGMRKLICYMSIGEAESYRWYWKPYWNVTPPSFLVAEDPDWLDNYNVRYWDQDWQGIICNGNDSYLKRIVNAGFDGVYLDLVSEYEYFE